MKIEYGIKKINNDAVRLLLDTADRRPGGRCLAVKSFLSRAVPVFVSAGPETQSAGGSRMAVRSGGSAGGGPNSAAGSEAEGEAAGSLEGSGEETHGNSWDAGAGACEGVTQPLGQTGSGRLSNVGGLSA